MDRWHYKGGHFSFSAGVRRQVQAPGRGFAAYGGGNRAGSLTGGVNLERLDQRAARVVDRRCRAPGRQPGRLDADRPFARQEANVGRLLGIVQHDRLLVFRVAVSARGLDQVARAVCAEPQSASSP